MDGRHRNNLYLNDQDGPEYCLENSGDSPHAASVSTSNNSQKRSRKAAQKRVVSVPIRDVEGSRLKGETPPPSDSWAWRKYGQKPIKGSPYPRGYYRCSSYKGCPARKQVERSRTDPTMLVVTYSCEHNHHLPASKNNNNNNNNISIDEKVIIDEATTATTTTSSKDVADFEKHFVGMAEESLLGTCEFKWFSDLESASSLQETPIIGGGNGGEMAIFPMGEEDESLFADLGELPECSVVFRQGVLCGTSG